MKRTSYPGAEVWAARLGSLMQGLSQAQTAADAARLLAEAACARPEWTVAVLVPDADPEQLSQLASAGPMGDQLKKAGIHNSLSGWVWRTQQHAVTSDLSLDARVDLSQCRRLGAKAVICLPIAVNGLPWGVMWVGSAEKDEDLAHAVSGLQPLVTAAAWCIRVLELERSKQLMARNLVALREVSRLVTSQLGSETVISLVLDVLTSLLEFEVCAFMATGEDGTLRQVGGRVHKGYCGIRTLESGDLDLEPLRAQWNHVYEVPVVVKGQRMARLVCARSTPLGGEEQQILSIWVTMAGTVAFHNRTAMALLEDRRRLLVELADVLRSQEGLHDRQVLRNTQIAVAIGRQLGLSEPRMRDLEAASLLREIMPDRRRDCPLIQGCSESKGAWEEQILDVVERYASLVYRDGRQELNPLAGLIELKQEGARRFSPEVISALEVVVWSQLNLMPDEVTAPRPAPTVRPAKTKAVDDQGKPGVDLSLLTSREQEILHLMAHGYSNREIAMRLYLSEATVKTHVSRVLHKLGMSDRTKAAVYVLQGKLGRQ